MTCPKDVKRKDFEALVLAYGEPMKSKKTRWARDFYFRLPNGTNLIVSLATKIT